MSIYSTVSPEKILRNPLNNSISKYQYSFSKSKRFEVNKSCCQSDYYDTISQRDKRSAGFGYGLRLNWTKSSSLAPSPDKYQIKGSIQLQSLLGKTFGLSRKNVLAYSYINKNQSKIPGPGNYSYTNKLIWKKISYSMRPKTYNINNPIFLGGRSSVLVNPGPGNYEQISAIKDNGKQFYNKYQSSGAPLFNPPNSARFPSEKKMNPGPGHYNPKNDFNPLSSYILSVNKSDGTRYFSQAKRNTFIDKSVDSSVNPGPGAYQMLSDFGIYDKSKEFYKNEKRFRYSSQGFYTARSQAQRPHTALNNYSQYQ